MKGVGSWSDAELVIVPLRSEPGIGSMDSLHCLRRLIVSMCIKLCSIMYVLALLHCIQTSSHMMDFMIRW
jgi:hypothetical protein